MMATKAGISLFGASLRVISFSEASMPRIDTSGPSSSGGVKLDTHELILTSGRDLD